MKNPDFISKYLTRLVHNFAEINASEIIINEDVGTLVNVLVDAVQGTGYKVQGEQQIAFRAAYIFENIYFKDKTTISFLRVNFISFLQSVSNESVKRHFGKILTDVIKNDVIIFTNAEYQLLAQIVTDWALAPKAKVAVQIWAFETLVTLRTKANIDNETISTFLEIFSQDTSPAMLCRLRRWKSRNLY